MTARTITAIGMLNTISDCTTVTAIFANNMLDTALDTTSDTAVIATEKHNKTIDDTTTTAIATTEYAQILVLIDDFESHGKVILSTSHFIGKIKCDRLLYSISREP